MQRSLSLVIASLALAASAACGDGGSNRAGGASPTKDPGGAYQESPSAEPEPTPDPVQAEAARASAVAAADAYAKEQAAKQKKEAEQAKQPLTRSAACSAFSEIVQDFTMTDEESATAFGQLAGRTADPDLAAAIQRVADGFARNDAAVSSEEVMELCD